MSEGARELTASEQALDLYLEDLLWEDGGGGPGEEAGRYFMFGLGGLAVAVPADRVKGESADVPPLLPPDGAPWLRRSAAGDGGPTVIDLALLVLPDDLAPRARPLEGRFERLLLLDDGSLGLALPAPGREELIDHGPVCWRGPRGRRPWLAGTLAERRCVLLDADSIPALVEAALQPTPGTGRKLDRTISLEGARETG
ncbi:MAG: hypothetical protein ACX93N_03025 [Pseudohaliea sp.]